MRLLYLQVTTIILEFQCNEEEANVFAKLKR